MSSPTLLSTQGVDSVHVISLAKTNIRFCIKCMFYVGADLSHPMTNFNLWTSWNITVMEEVGALEFLHDIALQKNSMFFYKTSDFC